MKNNSNKPDYILHALVYAFSLFILYLMEFLNWFIVTFVTITCLAFFYKEEFYIHKIERVRKKKMFAFLLKKYNGGKETIAGNYEVMYFGEAVLFSFSWSNSIQSLAKNSDQRIAELRRELVSYINEKSEK